MGYKEIEAVHLASRLVLYPLNVSNRDSLSFSIEVHFVTMMFLPTINMWHLGFKTIEYSS